MQETSSAVGVGLEPFDCPIKFARGTYLGSVRGVVIENEANDLICRLVSYWRTRTRMV